MRVLLHVSGIFSVLSFKTSEKLDCSKKGSYLGNVSKTESGKICQRWNVNQPHRVKHHPVDGNKGHNYCRTPDNDPLGPWCYTTDKEKKWEHCAISACLDTKECLRQGDLNGEKYQGTARKQTDIQWGGKANKNVVWVQELFLKFVICFSHMV